MSLQRPLWPFSVAQPGRAPPITRTFLCNRPCKELRTIVAYRSMDCHFAMEPLTSPLWDEALPLLLAHRSEVSACPDIPLSPSVERYAKLYENGALKVFTARNDNGRLIGYALYTLLPSLHYRDTLQASCDVVYVEPKARGWLGGQFLEFCRNRMFELGAEIVYVSVSVRKDFGRVLERQGYELSEYLYAIRAPKAEPTEFEPEEMAVTA